MMRSMAGQRVLVVEDDFLLAEDLVRSLRAVGVHVVGPVPSIDSALDLLDEETPLDGAVLDLNLQGEMAYPIADVLLERGVPFVFATGYDQSAIPSRYRQVRRCEKPANVKKIAEALLA